jgi:hypothetical protein
MPRVFVQQYCLIFVSDDDNIVDGTDFVGDYVEPEEFDFQFAEDAWSDSHSCAEVDAADHCFHWKGQDEVG